MWQFYWNQLRKIGLTGLTAGDSNAWELFQAAWQQLHRRQQLAVSPLPLTESDFQHWQQLNAAHRRPLFVLALAIHRMLQPDARDLSAPAILRALVQQYEINRLVKEAKQLSLDPYSLVMLRAMAGISGELPDEALRSLIQTSGALPLDIRLPALNQLKQTSLWSQTGIHALQPDLLAADLLHYALTEVAGDQAGAWQYCALETAPDKGEASSILGRLIHDAQYILQRLWPLQRLIDWISQDSKRSATINATLIRSNLERTLLPLAIATNQSAVQTYEQLAADNFAAYGPVLASSLNNLSVDLADAGRRAEGLAAIERAVAIREQLAADNFAAYGPDLAMSLNNLSLCLGESGKRAEGLAAIERAVAIREQLAENNFAAYGPDLASSLNNLSVRLGDCAEPTADEAKRLMEIRAQLQLIMRRIRGEHIQVPAHLAWLLESDPEAE